ncbi:MAG: hypothetical protein CMJ78_25120 [Planctomycetaceae bacterium]|nr:hypothetical protein [Planctomycetaceae bacterium]
MSIPFIGLDDDRNFVAFDYWANKFTEPFKGSLRQKLPAGTCRVLAVRPEADHPQLLSTSRQITQGVIDVLEEQWESGVLAAACKVTVVSSAGVFPLPGIRIREPRSGWLALEVPPLFVRNINRVHRT